MTAEERTGVADQVAALLGCDAAERDMLRLSAARLHEVDAFGRSLRDNLIRIVVARLRDRCGRAEADLRAAGE